MAVPPLGGEDEVIHHEAMIPYSIAKELAHARVVEWQRAAAEGARRTRLGLQFSAGWFAGARSLGRPGQLHLLRRRTAAAERPTCAV